MDLEVHIAGIRLEHPVMNAAGTCKHMDGIEGVRTFARSHSAAIMVGSATVEERMGNSGNIYYNGGHYSLNSIGLANPGMKKYAALLPDMVACAHDAGKPLFFSAAGFTPEEYGQLAETGFAGGADLVELNLGCPNVWDGGAQKRIACFNLEGTSRIVMEVTKRVGADKPVAVKISPMSDPMLLQELTTVFNESVVVKVVTTANTIPNALALDERFKPYISPGGGLAGMAGPALMPFALGQVYQLKQLLNQRISIIGVGGITTGHDVRLYSHVGAVAVQVATAVMNRGVPVFSAILDGLLEE